MIQAIRKPKSVMIVYKQGNWPVLGRFLASEGSDFKDLKHNYGYLGEQILGEYLGKLLSV